MSFSSDLLRTAISHPLFDIQRPVSADHHHPVNGLGIAQSGTTFNRKDSKISKLYYQTFMGKIPANCYPFMTPHLNVIEALVNNTSYSRNYTPSNSFARKYIASKL
jgi:hypothetical protein